MPSPASLMRSGSKHDHQKGKESSQRQLSRGYFCQWQVVAEEALQEMEKLAPREKKKP